MKVELTSECDTLSIAEVVEQLKDHIGVLDGEEIGECRIECGCDLEVDVTIDGEVVRTETFSLADIRVWCDQYDTYAWAKDEDGNAILLCFNN